MNQPARLFTLEDIDEIRRMMIEGRKYQVSSDAAKRILRDTRFTPEEINEAYAQARRSLGMK
jgi:hypothetical protein